MLTLLGGGDRIVAALLTDAHPEVRAQAAQWAAEHPEPQIVERLLAMLDDTATLCRFTVTDSLMRMGPACADPLLRHIVAADGAPAVAVLRVAAGVADARFLAPGLELCRAADPQTRTLAAMLVGSIGGARGTDALTELLADADADVRVAAATALGRLAHWPAATALALCLRDPAWDVRHAAAIALRSMGAAGLLLLRLALADSDRFARDIARQVLELPAQQQQPGAHDRAEDAGAALVAP